MITETVRVVHGEMGEIAFDCGLDLDGSRWLSAWTTRGEYCCTGGRIPLCAETDEEAAHLARVVVYALAAAWDRVMPLTSHSLSFTVAGSGGASSANQSGADGDGGTVASGSQGKA